MTGQQDLLDKTFQMLRESGDGKADSQDEFAIQDQLRGSLQELIGRMKQFGFDPSRDFSRADRSMERAARQLEANRPGQAVDHETAAIDQLRAGADALMQQLIQQSGEQGKDQANGFFGAPRDPMGRNLNGAGDADTSNLNMPQQGALVRAREILDELYKRASEQNRPMDELQYLQRLLRRF
jgi:hypothetical protein